MNIDKNEVLRYLGYDNQTITKELNLLIDETMDETLKQSKNLYTYKIYKLEKRDTDF